MKKSKLFCFLILIFLSLSIHAQTLQKDAWITNGSVLSMVKNGSTTYIGGNFQMVGPYTGGAALMSASTARPDLKFPRVDGAVFATASDGNGGWYIGGQFMLNVNGMPFFNLIHVKSDNSVDMSFMANPNQPVSALAVSGNTLYVGGEFTSIFGQPMNYLAAIDQTTGQLTSWNPDPNSSINAITIAGNLIYVGGDFSAIGGQGRSFIAALDDKGLATAWDPGADASVSTIAVMNNTVYAGGDFTSLGGKPRSYIAAIDTNGKVTDWNPIANQAVNSIIALGNQIYVGGDFTTIASRPRNYLAAFDQTGALTAWAPYADDAVNALISSGNLIYAGGDFHSIGGLPRYFMAALDLSGMATAWDARANGAVNAIAADGNNVCAGGFFTSVGGKFRNFIAALDGFGEATNWNPTANGPVNALAFQDGRIYAGGAFTAMGGQPRSNLAEIDLNGNVTAWNPTATGGGQLQGVNALAAANGIIYVGGTFTSVGGQNRNNIAALDLTGQATSFNPNAGGTFLNSVNALAVSGNKIYVGGNFSNIGGKLRNNLAALDLSGRALDWDPNANGNLVNTVNSLAVNENIVYAGGFFSALGGEARNYVGAVDENGKATPWNPDASGNTIKNVKTIVPVGNMVLIGGNFTNIGGQNRNYAAAIDENGQATPWNPNAGFPVNTMLVSNHQVYAGGEFFNICNQVRPYLAIMSMPEGVKVKIIASAGENGTISPSGTNLFDYGTNVTFDMNPNLGYHVADVIVDGQSVGPVRSYTFDDAISNHTISATFAIDVFTITAAAGENGTVAPAGETRINYGSSQTYTITPNKGYHIADVLVDGVSQGAAGSFTFSNVTANHTISASFAIDVFTIAAAAGENGKIDPSGETKVNYGGELSYSIAASKGYHIVDVLVDGVSQGAVSSYTFSGVIANHTISATFAIDMFAITATAGEFGSVSPKGVTNAAYGSSLEYTIVPDSGYHIIDVVVDGNSVGQVSKYVFTDIKASHTISAIFTTNVYSITASAGEHGTVSPAGLTYLNFGANQVYQIAPALGYHIVDVLVDGVSRGAVSNFTFSAVSANHTISATFAIDVFTISATCSDNGTLTPSGVLNINYGGTQEYTIAPNAGYRIKDVIVDGVSKGAISSYSFSNVTANHTISVTFVKNEFIITAASGEHGSVSPAGATTVLFGGSQAYTITPMKGYHITNVLIDGVSMGVIRSYAFENVSSDHSISAEFAIDVFTISASCGENGTIDPVGLSNVNYGNSLTYRFSANDGYRVSKVIVDGESIGAVSSFTFTDVTANHTVSVSFSVAVYSITAQAGENGTVSPAGETNLTYNGSQAYTFKPNTGYHIADVLIDGASVGAVESYTFTNVKSNHTVSVSFSIDMFNISASAGEHGAISSSGNTMIKYGQSVTYYFTPDQGYCIAEVKADGQTVKAEGSYTFADVKSNHTISVSFMQSRPAAPALITPSNEIAGLPVSFTMTWKSVPFAEKYRLQVASDMSFTKLVSDDSTLTSTSGTVSGLSHLTRYYWRVSAKNAAGSGSFSEVWSFTTIMSLPAKPLLVSPAEKCTNQPVSITLSWKKAASSNSYVLYTAADSLFTQEYKAAIVYTDTSKDIVTYTVSDLANSRKYYWRVNGENGAGTGPYSDVWSFTTIMPAPGMPSLAYPGNNSKDNKTDLKLSWKKASYAEKYTLQVAKDDQFKYITFSDTSVTDTSKSISSLKQGSKYYWRVIARNLAGARPSQDIWTFVTELNAPDSLVVSVLSRSKVKLTWKDRSSGAGRFAIERKLNNDFVLMDTLKAGVTTYTDSTVLVSMSYQYRVRAFTDDAASDYSGVSGATVTGVAMQTGIPKEYALMQNYPNPFNPATTIRYGLPAESNVRIEVYNTLGEKVTELFSNIQRAGYYEIFFDANNYSSGVYYCLIYARATDGSSQFRDVKKMLLIK